MSSRLTTLNIGLGVLFLVSGLLRLSSDPLEAAWWLIVGAATLFSVYGQRHPDRFRGRGWTVVAVVFLVLFALLTYQVFFVP